MVAMVYVGIALAPKGCRMNDMNKQLGKDTPILTVGDIQKWQMERAEKARQRSALDVDIVLLDQKIEAARVLAGAAMPGPVFIDDPRPNEEVSESMGEATKRILAAFPRAASHHEVQTELRKIPRFRGMLDKNNGAYYYTMVARLVKSPGSNVKRYGHKLRIIHRNETPPEETPEGVS